MPDTEVRQTVIGSGNIFTGTGDVLINYRLPPAESRERRVLLQLAASVKQFWIQGVLQQSVHEVALIALRKEPRPAAVHHPWESVLEVPGQQARPVAGDRSIHTLFDETGRALLILGEPGAGKTITLLELARDLIERFERDPAEAAPVVLNLSTWSKRHEGFNRWVEWELKTKYFVPARRSRAWLEGSRLILLLDGLDEVAPTSQVACLQSINRFLENTGVPGIAVSSRLADYVALPDRLRFKSAICLQPLAADQIDDFLARGGSQLAALRAGMQQDPILRELARSPLLLNVLSLAYQDRPAEVVADPAATMESRRRQLFESYVQRMFQRLPQALAAYPEITTRNTLSWLARHMRERSLTVFSLDQLQPDWLPHARDRWRYAFASRILSATVWALGVWTFCVLLVPEWRALLWRGTPYALIAGLVAGTIAGLTDGLRLAAPKRPRPGWVEGLRVIGLVAIHAVVLGTVFGVISALANDPVDPEILRALGGTQTLFGWRADAAHGFRSGLFFGVVFGLRSIRMSATSDIRLVEILRLSWSSARKGAWVTSLAGAAIGTVLVSLLLATQWEEFGQDSLAVTFIVALICIFIIALFFGAIGATFGMFVPSELPRRVHPGQWVRRSVQSAALAGGAVTLVTAVIFVPLALVPNSPWQFAPTLLNCCGLGVAAALWYGGFDALQHLTLRRMLERRGFIPKHYVRFLDHAARLIFLQKVGSGYLFVHRQLLDYFADHSASASPTTSPGESTRPLSTG